jgi:imidazolonepropionase-like amidohydrolase
MRRPAPVFLIMTLLASSVAIAQRPPAPKPIVFERARVIVGNGQGWIEDAVLVVEDGRFTQVGRRGTVKIPGGATRVNLSGKNVMPAMVDALTRTGGTRDELSDHLRRRAYYGAAAIMSVVADANSPVFLARDEIIPSAARVVAAGSINPEQTVSAEVLRALAARNVSLLTIGKLAPAGLAALVEPAHAAGLRVMAPVETLQDAKDLLRARVDVLVGLPRDKLYDKELVGLFREHPNVVLIPNLSHRGVADDFAWLRKMMREDELARLRSATNDTDAESAFSIQRQNLGRLHLDKVRIALGSESGDAWAHLLEAEDMSTAMNPNDVIVAASQNAAQLLGLKDHGAIVPGNLANFLVLNGNPALDIKELRNISAVYLGGADINRATARLSHPSVRHSRSWQLNSALGAEF